MYRHDHWNLNIIQYFWFFNNGDAWYIYIYIANLWGHNGVPITLGVQNVFLLSRFIKIFKNTSKCLIKCIFYLCISMIKLILGIPLQFRYITVNVYVCMYECVYICINPWTHASPGSWYRSCINDYKSKIYCGSNIIALAAHAVYRSLVNSLEYVTSVLSQYAYPLIIF